MKKLALIVATDLKNGISKSGNIPWVNKADMLRFKNITTGNSSNCVIYGKNTFLTLPAKHRCLNNRYNAIISSTLTREFVDKYNHTKAEYDIFRNLTDAILFAKNSDKISNIFICGGAGIYDEAITMGNIDEFYITINNKDYECDNFYSIEKQNKYLEGKKYVTIEDVFDDYMFRDIKIV
jgi:dihydrofolate reductase